MARPNLPSELKQVVESTFAAACAPIDAFAESLNVEAPHVIYHYTNDAGLRGILESGKLRFTDVFNLNDPSELRHGIAYATELINVASEKQQSELRRFSRVLSSVLLGNVEHVAHYFVCCFSEDGDELGQWRAYADNGRGYALGFNGKLLESGFIRPDEQLTPGHATFHVQYNEDKLRELSRAIIAPIIEALSPQRLQKIDDDTVSDFMTELSISVAVPILQSALFFKHPAYKAEKEYRFLDLHRAGPVRDAMFLSRPYSLVRYREFDWRTAAPSALTEIVIGPAADRLLAGRFAENCVRAFHAAPGTIQIRPSTIPYRAR